MHLGHVRLTESRGSGYIAWRVVFHGSCFEKWGAGRVQLEVASTSGETADLSAIFATIYTSGGYWFWLLLLLL